MNLQEITYILLAERYLNQVDSHKLVDWALKCIEEGYESKNLIILAGLSYESDTEEREKYFFKSLKDLGGSFPENFLEDRDKQLLFYARDISKKVLYDQIPPIEGMDRMYSIFVKSDYSGKYQDFCNLYDLFDCFPENGDPELLDRVNSSIKKEFELFLELDGLNLESDMSQIWLCNKCGNLAEAILKTKLQLKRPFRYSAFICSKCKSEDVKSFSSQEGKEKIIELFKENPEILCQYQKKS